MLKRDQLSPNQLRIVEAMERKNGGVTVGTNVPDLNDADTDAMVEAVSNAVPIPFDEMFDNGW